MGRCCVCITRPCFGITNTRYSCLGRKNLSSLPRRLGKLADGIVPGVPCVASLRGAEILCSSSTSRGADELIVHEPLRTIENHLWMIASTTAGGPQDTYPSTGSLRLHRRQESSWYVKGRRMRKWCLRISRLRARFLRLGGEIGELNVSDGQIFIMS